jgi:redox-sensing transcriptional repressor
MLQREIMNETGIPATTIRRLSKYYHYIKEILDNGEEGVTSDQIALYFGVHPTQVRKDLHATGLIGKPKVGHRTREALASIEEFLGWNNRTDAFLVGAGSLGTALLGYNGFEKTGVKIVAAFDTNPLVIGEKIHGIEVFPLHKLTDLALRMRVKIGILTCPAEAAQNVANTMIVSGITALWNFTTVKLYVPAGVVSEQIELYSSLSVLSRKLAEAENARRGV